MTVSGRASTVSVRTQAPPTSKIRRAAPKAAAGSTDVVPPWKTLARDRQELIEWASNLSNAWTWWATLTFRNGIPSHHFLTASHNWISWLSGWRTLQGERSLFRRALWSAEPHATGDVHIHALLESTVELSSAHYRWKSVRGSPRRVPCQVCTQRSIIDEANPLWYRLKESWWVHWGIARIFPFDPTLRFGAERYVTKYVLDEKCLDWGYWTWDGTD